ncbi:hypothetical protein KQ945_02825 [Bacillus subtilis subsp. subtilis]|nr:hypothetical protein [Bacillus subtilis subsp. subtilis]
MSVTRSAIGVAALWATLCVVLLAAGWLSAGRTGMVSASPLAAMTGLTIGANDNGPSQTQPPAPCPEAPASEPNAAAEGCADPEASAAGVRLRLRRTAWVATVPLWPADALRWQRMEPALRLNPGHAPPHA